MATNPFKFCISPCVILTPPVPSGALLPPFTPTNPHEQSEEEGENGGAPQGAQMEPRPEFPTHRDLLRKDDGRAGPELSTQSEQPAPETPPVVPSPFAGRLADPSPVPVVSPHFSLATC